MVTIVLESNQFDETLSKLSDKLLCFCNIRTEDTVLNRLHIVCVTCDTVITIKQIMIECTDLHESNIFGKKSFYFLFRNANL